MKKLLEHFFGKILGLDISIQEASPHLFLCRGSALKELEYQHSYVSNLLEMYGLSQVITYDFQADPPTLQIDFAAKWHDDIERSSYKFMTNNVSHWDEESLNQYAASIEQLGFLSQHHHLASHALLLFNFRTKAPRKIECLAERGRNGAFLTFPENGTSTVFYKDADSPFDLVHLGPSAHTANALKAVIFNQFTVSNLRDAHYVVREDYLEFNDQSFTASQLVNACKISARVGSVTNVYGKLVGLKQILTTFGALKAK